MWSHGAVFTVCARGVAPPKTDPSGRDSASQLLKGSARRPPNFRLIEVSLRLRPEGRTAMILQPQLSRREPSHGWKRTFPRASAVSFSCALISPCPRAPAVPSPRAQAVPSPPCAGCPVPPCADCAVTSCGRGWRWAGSDCAPSQPHSALAV